MAFIGKILMGPHADADGAKGASRCVKRGKPELVGISGD